MSMFRLPDEQALQELIRRSHVRIVRPMGAAHEQAQRPPKLKRAAVKKKPVTPNYVETLLGQMAKEGLPEPQREYAFAKDIGRNWRIDLALPQQKLAIEVEGMVHRTRERFMADMEKYNELTMRGWKLLRIYTRWIYDKGREQDTGIDLVRRVLAP